MPPLAPKRTVRLRQAPGTPAAAATERLRLLTYPMAFAKPGTTLPLVRQDPSTTAALADALSSVRGSSVMAHSSLITGPPAAPPAAPPSASNSTPYEEPDAEEGRSTLPVPRRWVRDADELCIASIHRSNNINRINSYVATYKFDDPQWRPLLLPEVHVLPKAPSTRASPNYAEKPIADYEVHIDHSKMVTLELMARHANFALRHLVQKGHAMYLVNFAQHSILHMRGLVEASYVTCAYGIRGERLRTHILHTGPVDARDVLEVDPTTREVKFNFKKANVRRGVVAVSVVEGYGTWFQRKPMLWQRTRRIGALQSQMGSYDYQLCDPASVGRMRSYEVSLLAPHVRLLGGSGGAEAIGLVASSQVAQNKRLYLGQFEAPALTALDTVQQLAHYSALHQQLLTAAVDTSKAASAEECEDAAGTPADPRMQELRRLAGMERLLPVSWVTRTPPPYVPLESDLPFRIQLSKPAVIRADEDEGGSIAFPTGGTVGSPFVTGVPLSLFEYNVHQGVDHYLFDDAPSARPLKWWSQKSNMPYNGYLYCMRSGLLDFVEPAETIANPLAPAAAKSKTGSAGLSGKRRLKRRSRSRRRTTPSAVGGEMAEEGADASPTSSKAAQDKDGAVDAEDALRLHLGAETLAGDSGDLLGHESAARASAALAWSEEGKDVSVSDRPPLHTLVAPNSTAQRRLRRYAQQASNDKGSASKRRTSVKLEERAAALLQRQVAARRRRAAKQVPSAPTDAPTGEK